MIRKLFTISLMLITTSGSVRADEPGDNVWKLGEWQGMPGIFRDGKPVTPMLFWQWKPEKYEVENFSKAGISLFSFFGSFQHYSHPYWKEDGSVEPTFREAEIRKLLSFNPEAFFLPRIFTTAPNWWINAHPEEACRFGDGKQLKQLRESFASEECLGETGEAYRKVIRHMLNADYRKNMLGVHVTNGPWGEHFYWDAYHEANYSDVSEPMRRALIRYLRRKYGNDVSRLRTAWNHPSLTFETVHVPGEAERKQMTAGAWRDPEKSRAVMDYFECHNEVAVDMIDHYCRIVKEESNNSLLTMAFYGYTQDENWNIENDHRAISKLLRSKNLDMLSAPHTYYRRKLGEDAEMRQYLGSAALHGKLFIDEGDDQMYLEKRKKDPDKRCTVNTVEESQSLLYREFGNTVTHGVGLWYMDLQGGWFKDPILIDTIGRMKKWSDVSMNHSRKRNSRVAVISAPESEYYLGYRQTPNNEISYGLYHNQMEAFYHAGAPFDWYLIDDIDAVSDMEYKVYVFLDCFYMTESQLKTIKSLRSRNRTLIWFYAPGYASQENLSKTRMEDLTGFRFEQAEQGRLQGVLKNSGEIAGVDHTQKTLFTVCPGDGVRELAQGVENLQNKSVMAMKKNQEWTSIFCTVPCVTPQQLRKWYRDAGVHVYTDCDDVLSANESWLMLHTKAAGSKHVILPKKCGKITEITTEKVIGEDIREFTIDLPKYSTAIFLME